MTDQDHASPDAPQAQASNPEAQALMDQAEQAAQRGDVAEARALYRQAIDLPHLSIPMRAQIQRRLDELRFVGRTTMMTAGPAQLDALMEQLVVTILNKSRPQVSEAVRLCAVPFWFDRALLTTLRESDDGLEEKILKRLARFSFIHQDDRGRYTFSEDVRRYLLDEWRKDQEGLATVHSRARTHFLERLRQVCRDDELVAALDQSQPAQVALNRAIATMSPEISELIQNYLYHTLVVDGDAGVVLLRQLFHAADEAHRPAIVERFLDIANEQRAWLQPDQRAHIDYLCGRLDQMQGRWDKSQERFERMLREEGLPRMLLAQVRRALGNTLVQREQWVEAIALFETALRDFRADGDELESALTMIDLGRAHLDLALNSWGGGEAFSPKRERFQTLQDLLSLVGRLPITVYLMGNLGVRALLPVILRVGRDMDWIVARLFVLSAGWFNRADTLLRRLNDDEGLGRVEENLAWLYLLLGHYGRAEDIYRRLLTREGVTVGEYRAARARLGLAETLMRQGDVSQARELLAEIEPVFSAYGHTERLAQTYLLLAQSCALEKETVSAVNDYQKAGELFRQMGDDANATEVVEEMGLLGKLSSTPDDVRQTIDATAAQVTRRRYLTRFSLPLLYIFRLLALTGLIGVLFVSLYTSIKIESGTNFGVSQTLLNSRQSLTSTLEPDIEIQVVASLRPSFEVSFALYLILGLVALYLVVYTLLGLWLTVRTPLRTVQEGQRFDVIADEQGVGRGVEGAPGSLKIPWGQIGVLLSSDRSLFEKPIALFSRFALFSEEGVVVVDGQTRRYIAARDFICRQLERSTDTAIPTRNFGFSILRSHSGRLFTATLLFLVAFVALAQVSPGVLNTAIDPLPYSLADLYSISYLGLLFPVGWWLGIQPLRERVFLKPHTRRVWLIGLIGLALAGFTIADLLWIKLPIGRPNIAPGLFAVFLIVLATYHAWTTRRWERMAFQRGDHVYALPVRLTVVAVALIFSAVVLGLVGREAVAYHYLAIGNLNQQRAAKAEDPAHAEALYAQALDAYRRALRWVRDDPDVFHSQGATLTQLGRYQEAVDAIRHAIALRSGPTAYYSSLALTHEIWAKAQQDARENEDAVRHFELARDTYGEVIARSRLNDPKLILTYLSRAGVHFQIGTYYRTLAKQPDVAASHFEAARADYAWVLQRQPENTAALSGMGWVAYQQAKLEPDPAARREVLANALALFEQAASIDPLQIAAWTGQGWAHFAIGETYAWYDPEAGKVRSACEDMPGNPRTAEEARIYLEENQKAIAAFDRAAALAQDDPSLYSVQGYIYYNLVDCPDADAEQIYLAAIESFGRALELQPDNAEWHLRRGNLYYLLIHDFQRDYYDEIIADYEALAALDPTPGRLWFLGSMYRLSGDMEKAVASYAAAVEMDPTDYEHQVLLGWWAYQAGDYERSIAASRAAVALDPSDPRPFFNWGLALVAQGKGDEARQIYEDGVMAVNALLDKETAFSRLDEGIGDLGDVTQDPADVADALRAFLTFKKARLYLDAGAADQAQATYEQALEIVKTLRDQKAADALIEEAIQDLEAEGGSSRVVNSLIDMLEDAQE